MVLDPVCKMEVDEDRGMYWSKYKGRNFYFCSPGCKKKFDEDPEKYSRMTQETGGNPEKCCD
jgi:YHS domain-containing protein